MSRHPDVLMALLALALAGCSPLGGDADHAGREVRQQFEKSLNDSISEERPERPSDFVPAPIVGRPEARPLRVDAIPGLDLTLTQCIEYMLPDWETKVLPAHPNDAVPPVGETRTVRFRGGSLEEFLQVLSDGWDVDVSSPHVGLVHVESRRLEPWLVTHWMQPPLAPGGGGSTQAGSAQRGGQQQGGGNNQWQQGNSSGGGGSAMGQGGSATSELVAAPGEGLEMLMGRLVELAGGREGGSERSVWLNAEAGLLYVWAPPSVRRAMRPLLLNYGARPVATDPELLTMMTRGHFRLRLVLVRIATNDDRNIGLQWEEGLQAVFPSGRSVLGVPDVGYGGPAREDRLRGDGDFRLGQSGLRIGASAAYDRDAVTFPFGSRWDLASERARQDAMQQVIELERQRTETDLSRVQSRIGELEQLRGESLSDGATGEFTAAQAEELSALGIESEKISVAISDLAREMGLAAVRSTQAQEWLDRVTEGAERDMQRSLSLLASLGSAHGQTQIAHTISIDARHGRPLPLRVGSERTFVGSISETVSETFSTTSATPETRLEGLDLVMRPWLEGRQCVRVGLALTSSGITSIASYTVGDTTLSIPQMAIQTWVSERRLCDSRPAMLGRFKLESTVRSRSGVPVPGGRQIPLSSDKQGNAEEYLLLLQVLLPPEWGLR